MTGAPLKVYLLALEPSGDVLGAHLMAALRDLEGDAIEISGVGGPEMQAAGLDSLFDPSDLAILGIFEVLPKAALVLRRVREVLDDLERVQPDILVTIDSWGFTGRVHKALAKRGSPIKRVRYVAPQVWAWRPGRAAQLARWIDHVLTLFSFEPPLFEAHGLAATWVGHPVCEGGADTDRKTARDALGIPDDVHLLTALPGSRTAEVKALMPVFGETLARVIAEYNDVQVGIATVANVEADVRAWADRLPVTVKVVTAPDQRRLLYAASDTALAASGTVTLELAKAGVPHVIAYRVNPVSAFVFRRLTKTPFVNLINVVLDEGIVPECLQEKCRADVLAPAVTTLMTDESARAAQREAFARAMAQLAPGGESPSRRAAQTVVQIGRQSA